MRLVSLLLLISLSLVCHAQDDEDDDGPSFFLICHEADSLLRKGDYSASEAKYRQALLCAYDEEDISRVHINIATICNRTGRYDDALRELSLCKEQKAKAMLHKGNIYILKSDYNKAISILDSVLVSALADRSDKAIAHQNKAFIYQQEGDYNKAKSELHTAMPDLTPEVRTACLGNYALILAGLHEFQNALDTIGVALQSVEPGSFDHTILLRKKAEILMMMNRTRDAETAYREYYSEEKKYAVSNFVTMTEQNRLDFWKLLKPNTNEIFALEGHCPEFLLDVSVFRREVALLGSAGKKEITRRLSLTGNDVRKALSIGEVAIDFVCYTKNDTARYGALVVPSLKSGSSVRFIPLCTESELTGKKIGYRTLAEAVCSTSDYDKDLIYNDSTLATLIWQPLSSSIRGKEVYFAPDGLFQMLAIEYLPAAGLSRDRLHRLSSISQLTERNAQSTAKNTGRALIVGGLDYNDISGSASSSAPNHDAATYLHKAMNGKTACFTRLDHSAEEIRSIAKLLPQADSTFCITEEQIKNKLSAYRQIHLSTHGYALQVDVVDVPLPRFLQDSITEDRSLLACGIALSGANVAFREKNREDGILSAREICDMNLKNTDLVVLAACQTAQGHVSDEGPAGIVRGLKKAGAKTIIATLWPVSDVSTSMFVTSFYKNLKASGDKHKAFQLAQNALRKYSCKKEVVVSSRLHSIHNEEATETVTVSPYEKPHYWAPFILIDNY